MMGIHRLITPVLFALAAASTGALAQPATVASTQVQFTGPAGMQVRWFIKSADGKSGYPGPPLFVPGRYNFKQGHTYRLKLAHIPGFPGLEVYPTLEVPLATPATQEFLAHNAVRLELTDDDFKQIKNGQLVVKTIYLPAANGAAKAGPPLLILRVGNLDGG
jgi:hypothetical protein